MMTMINLNIDYSELTVNSWNCLQNYCDVCLLQGVPFIFYPYLFKIPEEGGCTIIWVVVHATSQLSQLNLLQNLYIHLDVSNFKFQIFIICFDFFNCACNNNNKYWKFDTSKSTCNYQGHYSQISIACSKNWVFNLNSRIKWYSYPVWVLFTSTRFLSPTLVVVIKKPEKINGSLLTEI